MGVVLPGYLDQALDLIGISWPNVDEDDYREMATAMREFAASLDDGTADLHNAIQEMLGANEGPAVDALSGHWDKIKDKHLTGLADVGRAAGTGLDAVAVLIEAAKLAAIVQLGILAAEITAAIAAAPVTLGISTLGGVAGQQACRLAVKRIFKEVERAVVDEIVNTVTAPLQDALGAMVGDLVVQLGSNALGLQDGVDLGKTADAGKGALKLASAGDAGSSSPGGGAGASGQIRIDLASYTKLEGSLAKAGEHLGGHSAEKLSKAKHHQGRTRGRDPIANAVNGAMDQAMEGIGTGLKKAGKHLGDSMKRGVNQMKRGHEEHDEGVAKRLKSIAATRDEHRGNLGPTPVYRMKDNGVVEKLTASGPQPLTAHDRNLLGASVNLNGKDATPRRPKNPDNPYSWDHDETPQKDRSRKQSEEVPFDHDELSRATQLARHEDQSYGNYRINAKTGEKEFTSNNYASIHATNDQGSFILVGRSFQPIHSEKVLGIPFLERGTGDHVNRMYTERAPCSESSDCAAWVDKWLPGATVQHSIEYGPGDDSMARGNKAMENHLNSIMPDDYQRPAPRKPRLPKK
ncbi:nucleic acid/nucleotide deaminase domain-containing protein [Kitasatospora herbaricolor]|uniref:WXG100-like domain-containing protein n=1 Tax=Kitasatospora herbaricolor TaxID=68217 RepID=UPI0036DC24A7